MGDGDGGAPLRLASAVPLPRQLDGDGGPRLPARGVEADGSAQLVVGEFVAEVLRDVLEVLRVQRERLRHFARCECGRGQGQILVERLREAPRDQLLPAELPRVQQALARAVVVV